MILVVVLYNICMLLLTHIYFLQLINAYVAHLRTRIGSDRVLADATATQYLCERRNLRLKKSLEAEKRVANYFRTDMVIIVHIIMFVR